MTQIFELKTRADWEKGIFDDADLIERVAPSGIATAQLVLAANYNTYLGIETGHPGLSFSGIWSEEELAGSISQYVRTTSQAGAKAVAEFEGFGVDLFYMMHNRGGVARVEIDDTILANLDMYSPTIQSVSTRYFLSHGRHRLTLEHVGKAHETGYWLGTVEDVVGSSISPNVMLYSGPADTQDGNWGIYVETNYTYYLLNRRTEDISDSFYISNVMRRTFVPGVEVVVGAATLLNPGDEASFQTYGSVVNIDALRAYMLQQTGGRYASPVFDSLVDDANYWPMIRFETRVPAERSIVLYGKTGDTPTPDATWAIGSAQSMVETSEYANPLRGEIQRFGFEDLPTGRYFQFEVQLDSGQGMESPWLENMRLFFVPMKKDRFFNFFPQPYTTWLINGLTRVLGAFRAVLLWLNKVAKDLVKSYSISYATDDYLTIYGEELRVPRRFGESEDAYRARLLSMFQGYGLGGRKSFLEYTIGAYVGRTVTIVQREPDLMGWILGESHLGVDTYLGTFWYAFIWDVYVPADYEGVTEDQIRDFIDFLRPVGTVYTIIWT